MTNQCEMEKTARERNTSREGKEGGTKNEKSPWVAGTKQKEGEVYLRKNWKKILK